MKARSSASARRRPPAAARPPGSIPVVSLSTRADPETVSAAPAMPAPHASVPTGPVGAPARRMSTASEPVSTPSAALPMSFNAAERPVGDEEHRKCSGTGRADDTNRRRETPHSRVVSGQAADIPADAMSRSHFTVQARPLRPQCPVRGTPGPQTRRVGGFSVRGRAGSAGFRCEDAPGQRRSRRTATSIDLLTSAARGAAGDPLHEAGQPDVADHLGDRDVVLGRLVVLDRRARGPPSRASAAG